MAMRIPPGPLASFPVPLVKKPGRCANGVFRQSRGVQAWAQKDEKDQSKAGKNQNMKPQRRNLVNSVGQIRCDVR